MNPPVLSVQLRVGTTAAAPPSMGITVKHIAVRVKEHFPGFTLIRAEGAYEGWAEASAIIECIFVPDEKHKRPEDVYDFCEHVHNFMKEIFHELAQRQIIVSVSLGDGARDIRWSRATSWDGSLLINRPFLYPSLVAAHMVPG